MGIVLLWVLCDVDAKTEECSMGQKWPGSSTPAVASHSERVASGCMYAVVDTKGGSWRLSAPCIPHSLLSLEGKSQQSHKDCHRDNTYTPGLFPQMNYVCATPSSGEKTGGQRDKVT